MLTSEFTVCAVDGVPCSNCTSDGVVLVPLKFQMPRAVVSNSR